MLGLDQVQQLHNDALIERLTLSVRNDRRLAVRLLMELGEVQERGLYRDLGYSSMFEFATRKLRMSEAEAVLRIRAAKVGRAFPVALELLGRCEVNLTTLSLLAPVLTEKTIHLLHAARFKSKQEVLALIATECPKPDVAESVRRLPQPRASTRRQDVHASTNLIHVEQTGGVGAPVQSQQLMAARSETQPAPARGEVVQLSAERHKISFTGSDRVRELLQEAQDLRRHRYPAGELEPLFERALELLVAEEKKRKFGLTKKPRASTPKPARRGSRHIPHAVRREVWARDEAQCVFVSSSGQRCSVRSRLEFHHVVPFERGGASSADNIVLHCAAHNALQAERDYGHEVIRRGIERRSPGVSSRGAPVIPGWRQHEVATLQARAP